MVTTRLLGIDFGERKVGLAFYDGFLIEPVGVLSVRNEGKLIEQIREVALRLQIKKIVFGLPRRGPFLSQARAFIKKLRKVTDFEVETCREILTTKEALVRMKEAGKSWRKQAQKEDAVAAAILLEDYLAGLKDV